MRPLPSAYSRSIRPPPFDDALQVRLQQQLRAGLVVLLEALHPVLGVLAEERLECREQARHVQVAGGVDVPHLGVDRVGDARRAAVGLRHQSQVADVGQILVRTRDLDRSGQDRLYHAPHALFAQLVRQVVDMRVAARDQPLLRRDDGVRRDRERAVAPGLVIAGALAKSAEPVFTVSASLRTAGMVARRVAAARAGGSVALLVLSGGGLVRRLFGIVKLGWLLPQNSFRILRAIRRAHPDQPLWAVENPILPGPAARARRMQRKVDAGAQVILTQPPFLWGRFTRWLAEVERLGVTAPIVCGVPIVTSPLSLRTWLFLVGFTGSHAETDALLDRLRRADARGEAAEEGMRYTVELLQRLRATPGVAGVHMMPIFAWRRLERVLAAAGLGPTDRLAADGDNAAATR